MHANPMTNMTGYAPVSLHQASLKFGALKPLPETWFDIFLEGAAMGMLYFADKFRIEYRKKKARVCVHTHSIARNRVRKEEVASQYSAFA